MYYEYLIIFPWSTFLYNTFPVGTVSEFLVDFKNLLSGHAEVSHMFC